MIHLGHYVIASHDSNRRLDWSCLSNLFSVISISNVWDKRGEAHYTLPALISSHCWWSAVIAGFPDWRKTRGGSPVLSPRQVVIRVTVPLSLPTMTHLTVSILLLDLPPSLYHTVVTSHQGNILVSLAISNYRFYRLLGSLTVSSDVSVLH